MLKQAKGFISGVILMVLLFTMTTPSFAALVTKTIQVSTGVNVYVDDVKLDPKDANGNPVEVFMYNGTTYLPVRAISDAFDKPIAWDGETQSVYVGTRGNVTVPTTYLIDMDYFASDAVYFASNSAAIAATDNLGTKYANALYRLAPPSSNSGYRTFKLNGMYSNLSGTFYQTYTHRSSSYKTNLTIYGDGKLLYNASVSTGIDPIPFTIDVTGVLELKVVLSSSSNTSTSAMNNVYAAVGNLALYA